MLDDWGISCAILFVWMSLGFTDDKSTLVQVMAWCRQATSHYLNQCWPRSKPRYGVTRPQLSPSVTIWQSPGWLGPVLEKRIYSWKVAPLISNFSCIWSILLLTCVWEDRKSESGNIGPILVQFWHVMEDFYMAHGICSKDTQIDQIITESKTSFLLSLFTKLLF